MSLTVCKDVYALIYVFVSVWQKTKILNLGTKKKHSILKVRKPIKVAGNDSFEVVNS